MGAKPGFAQCFGDFYPTRAYKIYGFLLFCTKSLYKFMDVYCLRLEFDLGGAPDSYSTWT